MCLVDHPANQSVGLRVWLVRFNALSATESVVLFDTTSCKKRFTMIQTLHNIHLQSIMGMQFLRFVGL